LCNDLPEKHFLKTGATYRLLPGKGEPTLISEQAHWNSAPKKRVVLDSDSELGGKMCQVENQSPCLAYKSKVVLSSDITNCKGIECLIDDPRVIEVDDGVHYEYIRPACVQRAFYPNPKKVRAVWGYYMCADPSLQSASTSCCGDMDRNWEASREGVELFYGEKVTYNVATTRCGAPLCTNPGVYNGCDDPAIGGCDVRFVSYWTREECTLAVKINIDGTIALVHDVVGLEGVSDTNQRSMVTNNTVMFFRADWETETELDTFLSDYEGQCDALGCNRTGTTDGLCLCKDVLVEETPTFTSLTDVTVGEVLSRATFGAFEPDGAFVSVVGNPDVKIYPDGSLTTDTLFEVTDSNGVRRIRKNVKSKVSFGGDTLSFRNPVHFISLDGYNERDAQYETDAALEHYFYHNNTAPFLAVRFAQRFGISNPSPRYVDVIATAFRAGNYIADSGESFGSGKYGCMEALVAAVILDRESENFLLDADPAQ
jgi:hypothetical protein